MTCFDPPILPFYPVLVFLVGLGTFVACWGIGLLLLRACRVSLDAPWKTVVATAAGIQVLALTVELLAMAHRADSATLIVLWASLLLAGSGSLVSEWLRGGLSDRTETSGAGFSWPLGILVVANVINLLVAMAPSTKHDETNYHMLVPSRIVHDQGLHFYRYPWAAGIPPHMHYQIAAAPVYALGFPDAPNVTSWCLSVLLQWFVWTLLRRRGQSSGTTGVLTASICVGMYPVVWHVTGGGHALGDLATTVVTVALIGHKEFRQRYGDLSFLFVCSVLALSAATTKVSMLPFAVVVIGCAAVLCCCSAMPAGQRFFRLSVLVAPWVIGYLPLLAWTYAASGSPFGPIFSGWFPHTVYDQEALAIYQQIAWYCHALPFWDTVKSILVQWSLLVWIGLFAWPFVRTVDWSTKAVALTLLISQVLVIAIGLKGDPRYLGGLEYGLATALFLHVPAAGAWDFASKRRGLVLATVLLIVPWLTVQGYYAMQFFPVSLGLESREAFLQAKSGFQHDFRELDRTLPSDAVMFISNVRLNSVYSPRPVFFDVADMPGDAPAFWFVVDDFPPEGVPKGFQLGSQRYENPSAVVVAYRTPGAPPQMGRLRVFELIPTQQLSRR